MKRFNSVDISKLDKGWEHSDDNVEVGSLNDFFNVDFAEYFVKLEDNRYVGVVGIDWNSNAFLLM